MTGRHGEEEKGSGGGDTAGTTSGDLVNGAAFAAVGCRVDVLTVKKAGVLARLVDGTVDGHENDAATDDGLVTDVAGGGLARVVDDLVFAEPAGMLAMAEQADDLETAALCDSS